MSQIMQCPGCSTKLRLPAGTSKAKCPTCSQVLTVGGRGPAAASAAGSASPSSRSGQGRLVGCPTCQTQLKLPAGSAGKTVRCPKCSTTLKVSGAPSQGGPQRSGPPSGPPVASAAAGQSPVNDWADSDPFASLPSTPGSLGGGAAPAVAQGAFPSAPAAGNLSPYRPTQPAPRPSQPRAAAAQGGWESWLTDNGKTLKLCGMVAAASFVLSAVPFLGVIVLILVAISYVVIQMGGGVWLMVVAFQEEVAQGLLYLFVPFYALYYLITRWDRCRVPFMLCMVSLVSLVCSVPGFFLGTIAYGLVAG